MFNLFEWDNIYDGTIVDDLNKNIESVKALRDYINGNSIDTRIPDAYNTLKLSKLIVFDIVKDVELTSFDLAETTKGEKSLHYSLDTFIDKYESELYTYESRIYTVYDEKKPHIFISDLLNIISEELRGEGFKFISYKDNTFSVKWRIG